MNMISELLRKIYKKKNNDSCLVHLYEKSDNFQIYEIINIALDNKYKYKLYSHSVSKNINFSDIKEKKLWKKLKNGKKKNKSNSIGMTIMLNMDTMFSKYFDILYQLMKYQKAIIILIGCIGSEISSKTHAEWKKYLSLWDKDSILVLYLNGLKLDIENKKKINHFLQKNK